MITLRGAWLTFVVATFCVPSAFAGESSKECPVRTPETSKALDAIHAGRDGSAKESEAAIKEWLPRVTQALASTEPINGHWFHIAADMGGELVRLGRKDEARALLTRVTVLDADGEWGAKAAATLKALDSK